MNLVQESYHLEGYTEQEWICIDCMTLIPIKTWAVLELNEKHKFRRAYHVECFEAHGE